MWRLSQFFIGLVLLNLTQRGFCDSEEFMSLETEVFISESEKLYRLEEKIVQKAESKESKADPRLEANYYYLLSHLYMRLYTLDTSRFGLIENAAKLADHAISIDSKGEAGYLASAEIASLLNKDDVALKHIATASAFGNQSWRLSFFSARLRAGVDGVETTLAELKEILQRPNVNRQIVLFYILGLIKTSFGFREQVLELVKLNSVLPSHDLSMALANAFLQVGLYQNALSLFRECLLKDAKSQEARINIAVILYHFVGKKEEAKRILLDLVVQTDLSLENKETVLFNLGLVELKENRDLSAQKYYALLLKAGKDKMSLFFQIASAYYRLQRFKELLALIEIVNEDILPGRAEIYALKGEILNKKVFDLKHSLEAYEKAVILDQESKITLPHY